MFKTWRTASKDIMDLAASSGFYTRSSGNFPFCVYEIFATSDEEEALYDWATATAEHISCPTI